jgi:hypothetical protein
MRLSDRIVAIACVGVIAAAASPVGTVSGLGDQDPAPVVMITLEKATNGVDADQAPGPSIPVGDPITWTYTVTNTGVVPLDGIVVSDDQGVIVDCQNVRTLAVGASLVCTGTGVAVEGQYMNVGWVTALAGVASAMATDPSHYLGIEAPSSDPVDASARPKVSVCHRTGPMGYELIQIAAPADPAHIAHGDGQIGEAVPDQPGTVFGPGCEVVAAPPAD